MKIISASAVAAAALCAVSFAPQEADAHAFLMLPKAKFSTNKMNMYAYVVDGNKVPPFSAYTTGNAERNSEGFKANYKKLNPPSLKQFILQNQSPATGGDIPPGGTAECGFTDPNGPAQPLPNAIEFGNYQLSNREGIHPGPCEAYCDDEIVVPFTEDCRTILNKPIPYAKEKCQGKKRLTFYWLATHFAPFQVYIGCAPIQGGGAAAGGNNGGNVAGEANKNSGNNGGNNGGNPMNGGNNGQGNNNNNYNGMNNGQGNNNNNGQGNKNGGNNGQGNNGGMNNGNNGQNGQNRNNGQGNNNNNGQNRNNGQGNNSNNGQNRNNGQGNGQNRNGGNNGQFRGRSADWEDDSFNGTLAHVVPAWE